MRVKLRTLALAIIATVSITGVRPVSAAPTQQCTQKVRQESPALSGEYTNADAVGENYGLRLSICVVESIDLKNGKIRFRCPGLNFTARYTNNAGQLSINNPSKMPLELIRARKLALSGDPESEEVGAITGSIPKILTPGYKQKNEDGNEVDPKTALTKAEGQLAQGWVVENQIDKQKNLKPAIGEMIADGDPTEDDPYWDVRIQGQETRTQVGEENYQLRAKFGEVAPLSDRYGLLAQAVSFPTDKPLELPNVNCPADVYDPRPIVLQETSRKAIWRAAEVGVIQTESKECNIGDLGCIAAAVGIHIETLTAKGNLDVQSKVSLAGKAWSNMAGGSGAFSTLLPPGTVFKSKDNEDPSVSFEQTGGVTTNTDPFHNAGTSTLKIASLGTVGDTVDCLLYGLTAHPANSRATVCDEVIIAGAFSGWPTEHGCITQGTRSGTTHKRADAIDIGSNRSIGWAPLGQPAMSTVSGRVEVACNDVGGCGSTATIGRCSGVPSCTGRWVSIVPDEGDFKIWYFHLDSVTATEGQRVSPGTIVGTVGYSGNVFPRGVGGTHLHYEFKTSDMAPPKIPESPAVGLCW